LDVCQGGKLWGQHFHVVVQTIDVTAESVSGRGGRREKTLGLIGCSVQTQPLLIYMAASVAGHEFDQNTVLTTIPGAFDATRVTMQ
jgi:hypothetical protein